MKLKFLWFLIVCPIFGQCQDFSLQQDSLYLDRLPSLNSRWKVKSNELPYYIDNSRSIHFPPVIDQYGYSCNQASSIGYLLTYQINCDRGMNARMPENRLSPYFAWNFLNSGQNDKGVSYFDSWELVKAIGCPDEKSFGFIDATTWMDGYESYYRGMHNRIKGLYKIDVSTLNGLLTLKQWLHNQNGTSNYGACANFQIGSANIGYVTLPDASQDAGASMVSHFSSAVGHSMTIVGYNDSIWYDWNGDGNFTNPASYNDVGELTMEYWEKGAIICANTFGNQWENRGFVYVPYRLLTKDHQNGGIWMKSVIVAKTHKTYSPMLTLRISLEYEDRSSLWITAGVSNNPGADQPEIILDKPVFKFQGGDFPMRGEGDYENRKIELGLDITPLLNYVIPNSEAAFFLVLHKEDSTSQYEGKIEGFSIIDYTNGETYYESDVNNEKINDGSTIYRVCLIPKHSPPEISTSSISGAVPGEYYEYQLDVDGGEPPFEWLPFGHYFNEIIIDKAFPCYAGRKILPHELNHDFTELNLPFNFPYYGSEYDKVIVHSSGAIIFETGETDYPYAIDEDLLIAQHVAIYPNYNEDFALIRAENGVYLEESQEKVVFTWNVIAPQNPGSLPTEFSLVLYPDGGIEFFYEDQDNAIYRRNTRFLAGGNRDNAYFPLSFQSGFRKVSGVRFEPVRCPKGMNISAAGLFYGIPYEEENGLLIPFRVKDNNGLENTRLIPFEVKSSGNMSIHDHRVLDIFANPVAGGITIEAPDDNAFVYVYNTKGQLVISLELFGKSGYINTESWEKGIYFIRTTKSACKILVI